MPTMRTVSEWERTALLAETLATIARNYPYLTTTKRRKAVDDMIELAGRMDDTLTQLYLDNNSGVNP